MYFKQILDERCGCASYLVASRGSREAAIVAADVVGIVETGGAANGAHIDTDQNVTLEFEAQKYFYQGVMVSISTLVVLIFAGIWITFTKRNEKYNKYH